VKIIHIHTDYKFAKQPDSFKDDVITNDLLFIGGLIQDIHIKYRVENSLAGLKAAIRYANQYDMVVFYDLNLTKAYIANRINTNIPMIWRFFGYELYSQLPALMYSETTKKYLPKQQAKITSKKIIKKLLFNYNLKYRFFPKKELNNACKRINYFNCLSYEEYEYLSSKFTLPEFLQVPYPKRNIEINLNNKKGNKILIGNNRSAYNNHFDIIEKLAGYENLEKYAFLNYGDDSSLYYRELLAAIKNIDNFTAITNFLSIKGFENFYREIDAFVLNGYRQMAVANILTAFQYGVKVYLNKRNLYYHFLLNNGFLVFNVDDLEKDIRGNTITLTKEQIIHNHKSLEDLSEKFSTSDFVDAIKMIIEKSDN